MKKFLFTLGGLIAVILFAGVGTFYYKNLRGVGPALREPSGDIIGALSPTPPNPSLREGRDNLPSGRGGNDTVSLPSEGGARGGLSQGPLKLPPGFSIEIFARDLPGARVMAFGGFNELWVSQTSEGKISAITIQEDGRAGRTNVMLSGLRKPHGIAFAPDNQFRFYYAEENKISDYYIASEYAGGKLVDLPSGGGHFTRTLGFGSDGRLYVSIGSSCNVCKEDDTRRAAIYAVDIENKKLIPYATGLRNSVFFTWSYVDGRMWATEMGRDLLGDNLPPDEINIIATPPLTPPRNSVRGGDQGLVQVPDYGWPLCFGKNIHDSNFDKNVYVRDPCADKIPSYIDLPAHSAPLGLAFIPEEGWPEEYWYDLLVAYHGSWNRSEPTGYKVVRIKLDAEGNYEGMDSTGSPQAEDFISGWLQPDGTALGRPVDILVQPGGVAYISDDKAGVIYKVSYSDLQP